MNRIALSRLSRFKSIIQKQPLKLFRGIEKEGLRVTPDHFISQTNHPSSLGHALTHSAITTDYSEALLELITPVEGTVAGLLETLGDTQIYVQKNLNKEVMWSASMPCKLDGNESIRIGEYGQSNLGKLKHVYRKGLDVRYGRIMQSIAGLHFNFSLDDGFWKSWQQSLEDKAGELSLLSLQDFQSVSYFDLIRNFRRYSWLLMYLFGASPVVDQSFLDDKDKKDNRLQPFDEKGTWYKPFATSLRMGDLGYHNHAQDSLSICFNKLENFTNTLSKAIETPYAPYQEIGLKQGNDYLQLNCNILQIENEYYSSIRPKRTAASSEKPIHALHNKGVEYIEVRCLDLNPFAELGINEEQIRFMDLFLMYCLLIDSPVISDEECNNVDDNFNAVVNRGREPGLLLQKQNEKLTLTSWASEILDNMSALANLLDDTLLEEQNTSVSYSQALALQLAKVADPALTPSAKILDELQKQNKNWLEWAYTQSKAHQDSLLKIGLSNEKNQTLSDLSSQSHEEEKAILASDALNFDEYLNQYLS